MAYAAWSKRVLALLFDFVILLAMLGVAFGLSRLAHGGAALAVAITGYVIAGSINLYNKCVLMGRTGQTWGKRYFRIGLIREETGKPMGLWWAVLREIVHALDYLPAGVGFLRPIWDAKGQTFADKRMGTVAVDFPLTRPGSEPATAGAVSRR
jgi:uncharacterized RDD family membrane protein YckC